MRPTLQTPRIAQRTRATPSYLQINLSLVLLLSSLLQAAAQENPTERGDAAMEAGKYYEAVAAYTEAIDREPNKSANYVSRSAAYDLLNEIDNAIADANKAIELDPKNANAYEVRGWTKYSRRPNSEAIADLTKALEINPNYPRA